MTENDGTGLRCGLLGGRLGHSFSPQIHRELGKYSYRLFAMPEEQVPEFLRNGDFDAINVTIPYKQTVMPYCASISEEARKIGSVNTLLRDEEGRLHGYNTDYYGFAYMAARAGVSFQNRKILILGSGGTSRTVQAVAKDAGASRVVVVSRSGEDNYENLDRHRDADIIVNTTPVGMFPDTENCLLDLRQFTRCTGVLDVIYNPLCTRLLQQARSLGLPWSNGLRMLVAQARKASELFLGRMHPDAVVEKIHAGIHAATENIVLVGMPGCGKSTLGRQIADATGRRFRDVDAEIVSSQRREIAEIFAGDGEKEFRRLEEEAVREISLGTGQVIATGGGAVLSERNRQNLKQNGRVFYIRRKLDCLQTGHGRPLSGNAAALQALYDKREPLYRELADYIVDNNGKKKDCLDSILNIVAAE